MAHDWQYTESWNTSAITKLIDTMDPADRTYASRFARTRCCARCGRVQQYLLIGYDRMSGSEWAWRPLAGRCPEDRKERSNARERQQGPAAAGAER